MSVFAVHSYGEKYLICDDITQYSQIEYHVLFVTSEQAQRAERVLSYLREKSEYSRPDPTRPHHAL